MIGPAIAGLVLQGGGALENPFGLLPGLLLGIGKDRPHRQTETRARPSMLCRRSAHPRGDVAHLGVRLAPQRKGVGMFARNFDRGVGAAADEGVDAALLQRLHLRKAVLS